MVEKGPMEWEFNSKTAVSNGPFVLNEYRPEDRIILKKNPYYW